MVMDKNRVTKSIDDNMLMNYYPKIKYGNKLWVDTFCHPKIGIFSEGGRKNEFQTFLENTFVFQKSFE